VDQTANDLAGSKAGAMSQEMKFILEAERALLKCKSPGDVELVFDQVEKDLEHQTNYVDRIGLLMQALLMMESTKEAYNTAVDFFVKVAKKYEGEV
jgi:hypothetical protein